MKFSKVVSVIIPCFNSKAYLKEAIDSVLKSDFGDYEIIVVDDGSTDQETIVFLDTQEWTENIRMFSKENGGPASARNFGVAQSKGEFLLFLDSDNMIRPNYLKKAVRQMKADPKLAVVYSKPAFFGTGGESKARYEVRSFSFDALLAGNYIDMCSLVRKEAFLKTGGFDENCELFFGEDADLWVRISEMGWKFLFLDEVLFDYRVREKSIMGQIDNDKLVRTIEYFGKKHSFIIHQRYRQYYRVMDQIQKSPFSYFLRILYYKYFKRSPFIK